MQKLIPAIALLTVLGAVAISGSLSAGNQKTPKAVSPAIDAMALTLAAKDLPVVQVNEPF